MAQNTIKVADLAKVRDIEFVKMYNEGIDSLLEVLGVTRKIAYAPGTALKVYKTSGTLQDGAVEEGGSITPSKYKREAETVATLGFKKWSKETTLEAVMQRGYSEAVRETDDRFVLDIQKGIRDQVFSFIGTGTGRASGADGRGPRRALADAGRSRADALLGDAWAMLLSMAERAGRPLSDDDGVRLVVARQDACRAVARSRTMSGAYGKVRYGRRY